MDGIQPIDVFLDVVGQHVVGKFHIRETRVATPFGDDTAEQYRTKRRCFAEGHIGVPYLGRLETFRCRIQDNDLRMFAVAGREWVHLEFPQRSAVRHMLGLGEILIAKEQHLVVKPGLLDLGDDLVVKVTKINVGDLGADAAGHWFHTNAVEVAYRGCVHSHGFSLSLLPTLISILCRFSSLQFSTSSQLTATWRPAVS